MMSSRGSSLAQARMPSAASPASALSSRRLAKRLAVEALTERGTPRGPSRLGLAASEHAGSGYALQPNP